MLLEQSKGVICTTFFHKCWFYFLSSLCFNLFPYALFFVSLLSLGVVPFSFNVCLIRTENLNREFNKSWVDINST